MNMKYIDLQKYLFDHVPLRSELIKIDNDCVQKYSIKVFRNHSFELISSVIHAYLKYAGMNIEFHYSDYSDLLDTILKTIIDHGKGIEVNTAGLKYGMNDPNPHHDIIKRYLELGGEIITIGSDGHCPEHMAYDFHKLPDFLSSLGVRYYTIFRNKKPEFIKL